MATPQPALRSKPTLPAPVTCRAHGESHLPPCPYLASQAVCHFTGQVTAAACRPLCVGTLNCRLGFRGEGDSPCPPETWTSDPCWGWNTQGCGHTAGEASSPEVPAPGPPAGPGSGSCLIQTLAPSSPSTHTHSCLEVKEHPSSWILRASLPVEASFWAFLFMLSLMTLLLTHLISIWTDLGLILLPCNLHAHDYCNYAAEEAAPPGWEDLNLGLPGKGGQRLGGPTVPPSWQPFGAQMPAPR